MPFLCRFRLEHLAYAAYSGNESVYLLLGVVEGERCTYGACDAESCHQWLGAVMTSAHSNA